MAVTELNAPSFPLPESFRCLWVERMENGTIRRSLASRPLHELPPGEVLIRTAYSSLNYKDALAANGHPGVVRRFPHIPGVDAAGTVVRCETPDFAPGDAVVVTGYEMGAGRWGGYSEYVRVPREWVLPLPDALSFVDAMTYGTAGLTAAMCVQTLLDHGITPEKGEVVVTGASGGVGSVAVAVLAKLGFRVTAVTGKPQAVPLLRSLGAADFLSRGDVQDASEKPLLSGRWAGAVDTVGGRVLTTVLRSLKHGGCAAACGLAGGNRLEMTVYPFILRAVTLAGIDAAYAAPELKRRMWSLLAGPWRVDRLAELRRVLTLESLEPYFGEIPAGNATGRLVIEIGGDVAPGGV
ncbi:MAG: YhdH/YhfP family quinone oxidoreductase [Thermogutta sp.]|nr:YhdH/YhfP family quinone oxidoreductase [Thermogutta sp.]